MINDVKNDPILQDSSQEPLIWDLTSDPEESQRTSFLPTQKEGLDTVADTPTSPSDFVESDGTLPSTPKYIDADDNPASTSESESESTPPSTPETVNAEDATPASTEVDHSET